jgi:hypothetical protein
MVAPLIIGAARKVGAGVAKKRAAGPALSNRIGTRRRQNQNNQTETEYQQTSIRRDIDNYGRNRSNTSPLTQPKISEPNKNGAAATVKKIQAGVTSLTIFWTSIGFWIPQMVFWMIGIFGLGAGSIPFIDYVIPGELIYMLSYAVIVFIGLCTMFYAATVYYLRRVPFFSGYKGVIFIFCIVGYFVIFINFFPWFTIWLLAVTYLQDD